MPQCSTDSSLVSTVLTPVRLDSGSLVVHDETGYRNRVDLEELNYTNRELVNLENAAVNIENSTGVTIGPLTQFNVNGNVTIYQNGQENNEAEDGKTSEPTQETGNGTPGGSFHRFLTIVYLNQKFIRNLLIFVIVFLVVIIVITVICTINFEKLDKNFNETIYSTNIGRHKVFYRKDWKGVPPKMQVFLTEPAEFVVISHSQTSSCHNSETCMNQLRVLQKHCISLGYLDVGYNFFIGSSSDDNIYVGRGWDTVSILGNRSISIQIIGNFAFDRFEENTIDAVKLLIEEGVELKKISEDYKLIGENQTTLYKFLSPGINVYKVIKQWPHFYNGIVFGTSFQTQ